MSLASGRIHCLYGSDLSSPVNRASRPSCAAFGSSMSDRTAKLDSYARKGGQTQSRSDSRAKRVIDDIQKRRVSRGQEHLQYFNDETDQGPNQNRPHGRLAVR
jgi:hypothetical protein